MKTVMSGVSWIPRLPDEYIVSNDKFNPKDHFKLTHRFVDLQIEKMKCLLLISKKYGAPPT